LGICRSVYYQTARNDAPGFAEFAEVAIYSQRWRDPHPRYAKQHGNGNQAYF
jgi:hypothetical protein